MSYLTDLVNIINNNMEYVLIGVAVAALLFFNHVYYYDCQSGSDQQAKEKVSDFYGWCGCKDIGADNR